MKLMWKVTLVFVSVLALIFYFTYDTVFSDEGALMAEESTLQMLAKLPNEISESSGIMAVPGTKGQYLSHNDAGNKPYLYQINEQGKLLTTHKFDLPNVDWEDLTYDKNGNIYIADTGNNNNKRRELAVYKINLQQKLRPQAIRFTYEDQKEFPPSKKDRNFDCEAIFWNNRKLYLISKDRGRGETAKVYQLSDSPGKYQAKLIGSIKLDAQVTGAAISPNSQTVALLSEEKLHLFSGFNTVDKFYNGKKQDISLKGTGQTEGVAFTDDNTLIITSEQGNLYKYKLQD